jgi:hypothetical protein
MQLRVAGYLTAAAVFAASASLKLLDFSATAELFGAILRLPDAFTRVALATLIALEMGSAYLLVAHWTSPLALRAVTAVCISFLLASVALWIRGESNCGCFGAWVTITPVETVFKNLLLTAVVIVPARMRNDSN